MSVPIAFEVRLHNSSDELRMWAQHKLSSPTNYMRASMGQERLSALALMHIHYNVPVDAATVVDAFAKRQPRRLELLHWTCYSCLQYIAYKECFSLRYKLSPLPPTPSPANRTLIVFQIQSGSDLPGRGLGGGGVQPSQWFFDPQSLRRFELLGGRF